MRIFIFRHVIFANNLLKLCFDETKSRCNLNFYQINQTKKKNSKFELQQG